MLINIDRGDKIKVNKIKFLGNDKLIDRRLLKAMKKKEKSIKFSKRSKYIESDYKQDLTKIVDKLKESIEMLG